MTPRPRAAGPKLFLILSAISGSVGCGTSENKPLFSETGIDASAAGGSAGTGGSAPSTGSGGSAGKEQVPPATGGSSGLFQCAPPVDAAKAVLCLSFEPEAMQLLADKNFDGRGQMLVRVYDVAEPVTGYEPLAEIYLGDPKEISVDALPPQRIDGLPETVYVRSTFIDNAEIHRVGFSVGGAWLGGSDYSAGLDNQLLPVDLTLGEATPVVQPLTALRGLELTLSVASDITPEDDAQGPLEVTGYRTSQPMTMTPIVALARAECADLSNDKTSIVSGWLIGSGQTWLWASLDDYNIGRLGPGSLYNWDSASSEIPALDSVDVGTEQYRISESIVLNTLAPVSGRRPAAYSCP